MSLQMVPRYHVRVPIDDLQRPIHSLHEGPAHVRASNDGTGVVDSTHKDSQGQGGHILQG